jgi:hypothetical protein
VNKVIVRRGRHGNKLYYRVVETALEEPRLARFFERLGDRHVQRGTLGRMERLGLVSVELAYGR